MCNAADPLRWPDENGRYHSCLCRLERAPKRGLITGMGNCCRERRQAFCGRDQTFIFLVRAQLGDYGLFCSWRWSFLEVMRSALTGPYYFGRGAAGPSRRKDGGTGPLSLEWPTSHRH